MVKLNSRRRVAYAFLLLVSAVLSGCDWTMYRSNAAHTGASQGESVIGTGNVASLTEAWTAPGDAEHAWYGDHTTGPPIVAGGQVFVQRADGFMWVYDANGVANCGGSPTQCLPLWRADVGPVGVSGTGIVAVAGGIVYVAHGQFGEVLSAFDTAGATGCSGSPPTCLPLWSAVPGAHFLAPPTVVGGIVYVAGVTASADVLYAFDAAGQEGCSGTPTVCAPLWTANFGPPNATFLDQESPAPAVAYGHVFVSGAGFTVYVFDAAGQQNCDGAPKQCSALWTAAVPLVGTEGLSAPAVSRGVLYVTGAAGQQGGLFAFDAAGTSSCSGVPKQCSPLWSSDTNTWYTRRPPAISNGVVYAVAFDVSQRLRAFDAAGTQGCTGTPKICQPLWTSTTGLLSGAPTVANGVIYVVGTSGLDCPNLCMTTRHLYAFDASGIQGCSGTQKVCAPLLDWTDNQEFLTFSDPVVKNGVVYVGDGFPLDTPFQIPLGVVHAFTL